MQLITKAIITTIGVSTAAGFLRYVYLFPRTADDTHILFLVISSLILLAFLSAVIYYLIFNNDWLVRIVAPKGEAEGEAIAHADQQRTLAIWLRLLLVFYGLRFLAGRYNVIKYSVLKLLPHLNPVKIRAWIQGLFDGYYPRLSDLFSQAAITNYFDILTLALMVYLIIGAPHLVRWHVRRLTVTNNNTDLLGDNDNE